MWTRLLALASLSLATVASAQPADPPVAPVTPPEETPATPKEETPVAPKEEAPVPPTEEPPVRVRALDGDARNFERKPQGSYRSGAFIVRKFGHGVGVVIRVLLLPYRAAVQLEARYKLISRLRILVNDENTLGLVPTVVFQSAFGVNVGARAFISNYFGDDELFTISANTGGSVIQAYEANAEIPHIKSTPFYIRTVLRYEENDNAFFAGIGNTHTRAANEMLPATATATPTRYSQTRFLTVLAAGIELRPGGTYVRIGASGIYNDRSFGAAGSVATDPSIEKGYDTATLRGFDDGTRNLEVTGDFEIDTRDHLGATTDGAVVRGFAGGGSLVESARYAHYGAEAAYYLSPFWPRRTFVGRLALEGVVDRDDDIPFTELPRLGGAGTLRGYRSGEFRDRLATVATLEYHWPVHELVTGEIFVEAAKVGHTYDALLGAGFSDFWHVGYGGGVIIHTTDRIRLRLDVAYGDGLMFYASTDVLAAFRRREREL